MRLPIMGKLNGDFRVQVHHLCSVQITDSEINVQAWRYSFLAVHTAAGWNDKSPFCDKEEFLMATEERNAMLWEFTPTVTQVSSQLQWQIKEKSKS